MRLLLVILTVASLCIAGKVELIQDLNPYGGITTNAQVITTKDGPQFILDPIQEGSINLYKINSATALTLITSFSEVSSVLACEGSLIFSPQGLQYTYTTGLFRNLTAGTVGCTPNDQLVIFTVGTSATNSSQTCVGLQFANETQYPIPSCFEGSEYYNLMTITTSNRVYFRINFGKDGYLISWDEQNGMITYTIGNPARFATLYVEPKLYVLTDDQGSVIDETSTNSTSSWTYARGMNQQLIGAWGDEIYLLSYDYILGWSVYARYPNESTYQRTIVPPNSKGFAISDPLSRGFYSNFGSNFGFYNFSTGLVRNITSAGQVRNYQKYATENGLYVAYDGGLTFSDLYSGELSYVYNGTTTLLYADSTNLYIVANDESCQGILVVKTGSTWKEYTYDSHWQGSVSLEFDAALLNSKAVFAAQTSCYNFSLWATDGFKITRLLGFGYGNIASQCTDSSYDKYLYYTVGSILPEGMLLGETRGIVRSDGTPTGTNFFATEDYASCGVVFNGSYYYRDASNAMKISENGNIPEIESAISVNLWDTQISTRNFLFFINNSPKVTVFDGSSTQNLEVPDMSGDWELAAYDNTLYFITFMISEQIRYACVYKYDAELNLVMVANLTTPYSTNNGVGIWDVNNTLIVSDGENLWTSTDGVAFEMFGPYAQDSNPILINNDVIYSAASYDLLIQKRNQEIEYTSSATFAKSYENSIWYVDWDTTEWVSLDVITNVTTVQAQLTDITIPVFLGNGYSLYASGGDQYGIEPRRIPGPGIPPQTSSSSVESSSSTTSSSQTTLSQSISSGSTSSSNKLLTSSTSSISDQNESSGSFLRVSTLISMAIVFIAQ